MKMLRIITAVILSVFLIKTSVYAAPSEQKYLESYVLMEASTKTVLRERDGYERVKMGTLNKLMVVLLAAEAIDRGELQFDDMLTADEEANATTGAKIWLMTGDKISVEELLKAVIIGNANDAACVLAKKLGITTEKFTEIMNRRAKELNMNSTYFTEYSGYSDNLSQYTTAYDTALLLCELSAHTELTPFFTTRLDTVKNDEVQLVTTNKLSYNYKGSVGFKSGCGPQAAYFSAQGAVRDDVCYVAAVMDCEDEDYSLALSRELLDIGFSGYTVVSLEIPQELPEKITVRQGCENSVRLSTKPLGSVVVSKGSADNIEARIYLPSFVYAQIKKGDKVGEIGFYINDKPLKICSVYAADDVNKKEFKNVLSDMLKSLLEF